MGRSEENIVWVFTLTKQVVFNVYSTQSAMYSSTDKLNKNIELQSSSQESSKIKKYVPLWFIESKKLLFTPRANSKNEKFNFFHNIVKFPRVTTKKRKSVLFWLHCPVSHDPTNDIKAQFLKKGIFSITLAEMNCDSLHYTKFPPKLLTHHGVLKDEFSKGNQI